MTDKGSNFFNECAARYLHLFPQEKECAYFFFLGDSSMYTFSSIRNLQRMQTKRNESGTIAK